MICFLKKYHLTILHRHKMTKIEKDTNLKQRKPVIKVFKAYRIHDRHFFDK